MTSSHRPFVPAAAVLALALGACASSSSPAAGTAQVVGGEVRTIVVDGTPPEGSDDLVRVTPQVDATTHCLTDEHGHPLAFPTGTELSGTPDDWTLTTPDGATIDAGEEVEGGAEDDQSMDYVDDLPDECGPPPWHVYHEEVRPGSSPS